MPVDTPGPENPHDTPFKNYLCAVGAATAVTIFDGIQNSESAALKKAGFWFSNFFADGRPSAVWSVSALIFFGLFSALMVLAYKPRATKESFLLGLGVLAMLNSFIKPQSATRISLGLPMASAHAQGHTNPQELVDVWFFVNGPAAVPNPGIHLNIYPANGKGVVQRQSIRPIDNVKLPPGRYHFEFSHPSYRSILFSADIDKAPVAFTKLFMRPTDFDAIINLFGAESAKPRADTALAAALRTARAMCELGDRKSAANVILKVRPEDHLQLFADDISRRQYCVESAYR